MQVLHRILQHPKNMSEFVHEYSQWTSRPTMVELKQWFSVTGSIFLVAMCIFNYNSKLETTKNNRYSERLRLIFFGFVQGSTHHLNQLNGWICKPHCVWAWGPSCSFLSLHCLWLVSKIRRTGEILCIMEGGLWSLLLGSSLSYWCSSYQML